MEFYFAKGESGSTAIPTFHRTTTDVPDDQGFEIWQRDINILFDAMASEREVFSASVTVYHFSRFLLCSGRLDGARYRRDAARLGWCTLDHYLLHLPLQKGLACSNGLRVRAFDVVMLDLSQPADFRLAASEGVSLLIPRTTLAPLLPDTGQLHGLVLRRETASGALLGSLLSSLAVATPRFAMEHAFSLSMPLLGMVAACMSLVAACNAVLTRGWPAPMGRRARLYIEQNLHRDNLTPAVLAKELGVSRSQLYRAFETYGGVRHYVLQRRLRRCLFALFEPCNSNRRIADVAYEHGFADEAHFSRLFRKAFGMSPRAARTAMQRGAMPGLMSGSAETPVFAHWVQELMDI